MKKLKVFGLFAIVILSFNSCDRLFGNLPPESVGYELALSFQDSSGNDLVKGIELEEWPADISMENAQWGTVKSDTYKLDIIVSEACENRYDEIGFELDNRHILGMYRYDYNYLRISFGLGVSDCPEEKMLIYSLKCPYVFGDDDVHELVTYWEIQKSKNENYHIAKCYLINFEGNDITPTLKDGEMVYAANIILK